MEIKHYLRSELAKFKASSRQAVIDGNQKMKDAQKAYFHIEREVERELRALLQKAANTSTAQLILICGNVGDGKSHLLARLHEDFPDIMEKFQVHNDATESDSPSRTFLQTLEDRLSSFKDTELDNSQNQQKTLLAINLGTLANFLDSKESNEFTELASFVENRGILKQHIGDNNFNPDSPFQYINFTDFHLYTLSEEGASSPVIQELLDKIVKENDNNPVYSAYLKTINQEGFPAKSCPIVINYELLCESAYFRQQIEQLLIQVVISFKHIISIRSLLNFIFDLLVPAELSTLSEKDLIKVIREDFATNQTNILPNLSFNYLFEHPSVSSTFGFMKELDPVKKRDMALDMLLIKAINSKTPSREILEYFENPTPQWIVSTLFDLPYSESGVLEKSIIRLLRFSETTPISFSDKPLQDYCELLFSYNKGNIAGLKELYRQVEKAIYSWNGKPYGDKQINTFIGAQQNKYKISAAFSIQPQPKEVQYNLVSEGTDKQRLYKFLSSLTVYFSGGTKEEPPKSINIDYNLYQLIRKINLGYRPNQFDKSDFVDFSNFIKQLISDVLEEQALFFIESNQSSHRIFSLELDSDFGETFTFKERTHV